VSGSRAGRERSPLSPVVLGYLREVAALVHVEPALRVRLRDGDQVLATVAAEEVSGAGARWLHPCGFRSAVGDAWSLSRAGREVGVSGLSGDEPGIDVGAPGLEAAAFPFGIHRWLDADEHGERWRWAVAMTGTADGCLAVCRSMGADPRCALLDDVRLRDDPLLDACVLRATTARGPEIADAVAGLLGDVVVGHAVARLTASV